MLKKTEQIKAEFLKAVENVRTQPDLAKLKADFIGKKGVLSEILKEMKGQPPEIIREIGQVVNQLKTEIEKTVDDKMKKIEAAVINEKLKRERIDVSLRESLFDRGLTDSGYHPVTLIQREVEDVFTSMGFEILDGPHIEDDYHNFVALNIPEHHPARDMQDTFWFSDLKHLLRTHTSPIQVRGMESRKPPFKFVGPGKVFRNEATDASHEMVFHQIEGMMVDENITVSHLIYFMKTLLSEIFGRSVEVRLRPGFFPFVEPGFELDIKCLICGGKGCSVCKHQGWLELLPCGMVHPNVLTYSGIDIKRYNGFAFGLGLDRLVMMRYGIDDIRHFHGGDLRFIRQFKSC